MQHFYVRAIAAKQMKQPDKVIDAAMIQAVQIAEKIAPYRHARLSAVKLAGDPNNPARFKDDATADELREEVMRRLGILAEAGVIDLQALPVPKGGIANEPISGDQLASTGNDFIRTLLRTVPISVAQRICLVSNSASAEQCQSRIDSQ